MGRKCVVMAGGDVGPLRLWDLKLLQGNCPMVRWSRRLWTMRLHFCIEERGKNRGLLIEY